MKYILTAKTAVSLFIICLFVSSLSNVVAQERSVNFRVLPGYAFTENSEDGNSENNTGMMITCQFAFDVDYTTRFLVNFMYLPVNVDVRDRAEMTRAFFAMPAFHLQLNDEFYIEPGAGLVFKSNSEKHDNKRKRIYGALSMTLGYKFIKIGSIKLGPEIVSIYSTNLSSSSSNHIGLRLLIGW